MHTGIQIMNIPNFEFYKCFLNAILSVYFPFLPRL